MALRRMWEVTKFAMQQDIAHAGKICEGGNTHLESLAHLESKFHLTYTVFSYENIGRDD
jgi:hypothetical protein